MTKARIAGMAVRNAREILEQLYGNIWVCNDKRILEALRTLTEYSIMFGLIEDEERSKANEENA